MNLPPKFQRHLIPVKGEPSHTPSEKYFFCPFPLNPSYFIFSPLFFQFSSVQFHSSCLLVLTHSLHCPSPNLPFTPTPLPQLISKALKVDRWAHPGKVMAKCTESITWEILSLPHCCGILRLFVKNKKLASFPFFFFNGWTNIFSHIIQYKKSKQTRKRVKGQTKGALCPASSL